MRPRLLAACLMAIASGAAPAVVTAQRVAMAGDTVTVEYRALLTPDLTQADARRRAIEGALAEAVRRVAGVQVHSGTLAVTEERAGQLRDDFVSVVQLEASGRVVDYQILDEDWVTTRHPELGAQVYLRLRLRAVVAHEVGRPDAAFRLDLTANQPSLTVRSNRAPDNDELVVAVTASRASNLALFSVADDSVVALFPNEYVPRTPLSPGVSQQFPEDEWRNQGLRLRASLPEGRDARREVIMAVATRGDVPPFHGTTALELQRWLVSIPLEQRALATTVIEVRRVR